MITSSIVPTEERTNFFLSITEQYFWFQDAIFHFCKVHCVDFYGGFWQYIELDNGGKYLYPVDCPEILTVTSKNHQVSLKLSSEATGIYITLVTLSYYAFAAWRQNDAQEMDRIALLEKKLMDFAEQHPEFHKISELLNDEVSE